MGAAEAAYVLPVAAALRNRGIAVEIYPDSVKLKKQFDYADRKAIPFLSVCGADEMASRSVLIKNLSSGEQRSFPLAALDGMIEFMA